MIIIKDGKRYNLLETKEIELVGNYQIVDKAPKNDMPRIFDDLQEALKKFDELNMQ